MPTAVTTTSWHGIRLNQRLRDLNAYLVMWHAVMTEDDLREGEITGIEVARKKLALLNVGGEIRAFEDRRPPLFPTQ
jgi:Rieske [2Fe-2S] domain